MKTSITPRSTQSPLITEIMAGAADADGDPPWWDGTVIEHRRVSRDLAVIRLRLEEPLPYLAGQYVKVETPQCPSSLALPSSPHRRTGRNRRLRVRAVSGDGQRGHGQRNPPRRSVAAVGSAGRPGGGPFRRRRSDGCRSTGSAAAGIIMDMVSHEANPHVHLFFGARYPCELYDLRMLWTIAITSPNSDHAGIGYRFDPPWAMDYPDARLQSGLLAIKPAGFWMW